MPGLLLRLPDDRVLMYIWGLAYMCCCDEISDIWLLTWICHVKMCMHVRADLFRDCNSKVMVADSLHWSTQHQSALTMMKCKEVKARK